MKSANLFGTQSVLPFQILKNGLRWYSKRKEKKQQNSKNFSIHIVRNAKIDAATMIRRLNLRFKPKPFLTPQNLEYHYSITRIVQ